MIKRTTSFILCLCLMITIIPKAYSANTPAVASGNVLDRIELLMEAFPEDSHFTVTGKTCSHRSGSTCSNCQLSKIMDSMGYANSNRPRDTWMCVSFATFAFWYIFGIADNTPAYSGTAPDGASVVNISNARPGDMVILKRNGSNYHYGIYLSHTVSSNGSITVTLFDANGKNTSIVNEISHNKTFTYTSGSYIVQANNYDEIDALGFKIELPQTSIYYQTASNTLLYSSPSFDDDGILVNEKTPLFINYAEVDSDNNIWCKTSSNLWVDFDNLEPIDINLHSSIDFIDVDVTAYYSDPVSWAVSNGITAGTGDFIFSPDNTATLGQALLFIYRAVSSPSYDIENPYLDVSSTAYYYDAVMWAFEQGLISVDETGVLNPEQVITREKIVTFLHILEGQPLPNKFFDMEDVFFDSTFFEAVSWALAEGITSGTSETTFSPFSLLTRAQTMTFLYRYFN